MTLTAANVNVAVTGAVYATEAGTTATAPATSVDTLDTLFNDLGYVSSDGIVEAYADNTTELKAWQSGTTVRTVISGSTATLKFMLIENTRQAAELYHKGSTVVTDGSTGYKMDVMTPTPDHRQFVLDVVDGDDNLRIYVADGEVSNRGDITYKSDTEIGREITITMYPVNGVVCTKYTNKASWAPAA